MKLHAMIDTRYVAIFRSLTKAELIGTRLLPYASIADTVLDYSQRHWSSLMRFADDGQLPLANNWIENQIRPIAIGRNNWLFVGRLRAGQRAAAAMSLVQSARMNRHAPYAYLRDVLMRLPAHRVRQIEELLPRC